MRSKEEIERAIKDLTPTLAEKGSPNDVRLALITIDALKWVLGEPSVCETAFPIIRQIRQAQESMSN